VPKAPAPNRRVRRHPDEPLVLDFTAASRRLGVSVWTLKKMRDAGTIATVQVAGREKIATSEVDDYIERNTRRAQV
jgi:predicted site-specific integrase-resolvase